MFDGAIASGLTNTGTQTTQAQSVGNYAGGPDTAAFSTGTLGVAVAQGSNVDAIGGFAGNLVFAGVAGGTPATQSTAFAIGANENRVNAGPGPGNVAGLVNAMGQKVKNNIH
jgi:hypothetical protein